MTKAAQIVKLYAAGMSIRAIAEVVGCDPSYVRVAARQRKGAGMSPADRRYRASDLYRYARKRRYHEDADYRQQCLERSRINYARRRASEGASA